MRYKSIVVEREVELCCKSIREVLLNLLQAMTDKIEAQRTLFYFKPYPKPIIDSNSDYRFEISTTS